MYWRDIPSQVVVRRRGETSKRMLSERFQQAIDRAAMRAGKTGSAHYLADWRRAAPETVSGDPSLVAQQTADQLEQQFSDDDLLRLIRSHGIAQPAAGDSRDGR